MDIIMLCFLLISEERSDILLFDLKKVRLNELQN